MSRQIVHAGGLWRIGAGLPQLEPHEEGFGRGPNRVTRGAYGGPPPKKVDFFFYVRGQESACPFMARLVLKSQGGGGAMVPRSTPVGEVPPPLSAFYTGLIRRRRGRWKFSSPWHRKNAPYSRFFSAAIAILGVDLIPGCARNGGSPPLAPRGRGGGAFFFQRAAGTFFYRFFFQESIA